MVVEAMLLLEPVDHVANRILRIDPQIRAVPGGAIPAGGVPGRGHGAAHLVAQLGKVLPFTEIEAEGDEGFHFDTGAANFAIALGGMAVATGEEPARSLNGEEERRTGDKLPDIEIAANTARWHRAVRAWLARGQAHHPAERLKGHHDARFELRRAASGEIPVH